MQDSTAPKFSDQEPFYNSQLRKDLYMNVYHKGAWGSMRHLNIALQNNNVRPVDSACVEVLNPGDLSSLSWVEAPCRALK